MINEFLCVRVVELKNKSKLGSGKFYLLVRTKKIQTANKATQQIHVNPNPTFKYLLVIIPAVRCP